MGAEWEMAKDSGDERVLEEQEKDPFLELIHIPEMQVSNWTRYRMGNVVTTEIAKSKADLILWFMKLSDEDLRYGRSFRGASAKN